MRPAFFGALDLATAYVASALRLGAGGRVRTRPTVRPARPLELYEFEACPFCRKVREALSALDLDAMVYPCPRGGERFRPTVVARGGRASFPFLVDPNRGVELYESSDIVGYLEAHYGAGPGSARPPIALPPLMLATSGLASALRAGHGRCARPSRAPAQPLALWSREPSPACRTVRERLCELELPYHLINVAEGSGARAALVAKAGAATVPYLEDPNRGAALVGSAAILAHLERSYTASASG
jgi:glutathione S-transferase